LLVAGGYHQLSIENNGLGSIGPWRKVGTYLALFYWLSRCPCTF
jgi:hypothetical protein